MVSNVKFVRYLVNHFLIFQLFFPCCASCLFLLDIRISTSSAICSLCSISLLMISLSFSNLLAFPRIFVISFWNSSCLESILEMAFSKLSILLVRQVMFFVYFIQLGAYRRDYAGFKILQSIFQIIN